METVYPISNLGCSFLRLSFDEWLNLPESRLFALGRYSGDTNWFFVEVAHLLSAISPHVRLLKVGNTLYKLDGNKRKDIWVSKQDNCRPPDFLIAQVFEISEQDYLDLDARVKSIKMRMLAPNDAVKDIYDELGLVFNSKRLKGGLIIEAFNIALRGRQRALQDKRREQNDIDMYAAIKLFTSELKIIDSLNVNSDVFVTGVLAAALLLLSIKSNSKVVGIFLAKLNHREVDVRDDGSFDPIAALLRSIDSYRASSRANIPRLSIDLCKKTIQAFLFWKGGEHTHRYWRKRELPGVDHMPYVHELRKLKQINEARDL